jgi:hypothetical protein
MFFWTFWYIICIFLILFELDMNLQSFFYFLEFLINRDTFLTGSNPNQSHWLMGPGLVSSHVGGWPRSKWMTWQSWRHPTISPHSWSQIRWFRPKLEARLCVLDAGDQTTPDGSVGASFWSPELAPVSTTTAADGGLRCGLPTTAPKT